MRDNSLLGLIDIGTSKVVCLVVAMPARGPRADKASAPRIVGLGHGPAQGVKAGVIVDLAEAEAAIRATVDKAERMAGATIENVVVALSTGRLGSATFAASADVAGPTVAEADVARAVAGGRAYAEREGRTLVQMNGLGFRLDEGQPVRAPRGLAARRLSAQLHAVTADEAPVRNILHCLERCYLTPVGLVAAPYAAGLAVTTEEERRLGITVVDIGGGASAIAVFGEGALRHVDVVPVGGDLVTFDLARALQTPLAHAERIKALYGAAVEVASGTAEPITFPLSGEEDATGEASRAQVVDIVRRRLHAIGGLIAERLARTPVATGTRVVLTGGGSEVAGIAQQFAALLNVPVRTGRPQRLEAMPAGLEAPAMAVTMGLVASLAAGEAGGMETRHEVPAGGSYLRRVGEWLRDGF
jgi:cell division protein FtsA